MFLQATTSRWAVAVQHDFAMVRPGLQRPEFNGPGAKAVSKKSKFSLFSLMTSQAVSSENG